MPLERTIHLISHTHWDREWYLTFQQFRMKLVHALDRLLDIYESDPNFRSFMLDGQTIALEDYLAIRPEKEDQLRTLISAGRLLIGPWYILADENLVSPEALVRNLLEGLRQCARFGGRMPVGYTPDPFGHIGQLPQILRGFGIENACLWRGLADQPSELEWESPDGSRVETLYLRESYSNAANLPVNDPQAFLRESLRLAEKLALNSQSRHLVLMHGTDHAEPEPATGACLAYAQESREKATIYHSTMPDYFAALASEKVTFPHPIPVIKGELRECRRSPLLPGVLSARMWIKQRNHACQNLLERWAEPASAWAQFLDRSGWQGSPHLRDAAPLLRQAWRMLLQCHPHDSICGCSIDQVHEEMRSRFDQVEQIGEEITHQSLERITSQVDTQPPQAVGVAFHAIVVFNPVEGPQNGLVESDIDLPEGVTRFEVVDETGKAAQAHMLGLGSRELLRIELNRKDFLGSLGMVQNGVIMGMVVREFNAEREGECMNITLILAENGQVNEQAWQAGMEQVHEWAIDPTITKYRLTGRSPSLVRFQWIASDVPGFGYRTFWIRGLPAEPQPVQLVRISPFAKTLMPLIGRLTQSTAISGLVKRLASHNQKGTSNYIENEFLKVEVASGSGQLILTDKRSGRVYPGLHRFVDGGDRGDTYNFCPPEGDYLATARIRHVEVQDSEVESRLEIDYLLVIPTGLADDRRNRSAKKTILKLHSQVRLSKGLPRVEIRTEIDNHACDHRLRVHFQTPFHVDFAQFDGAFEIVRRPLSVPEHDSSWGEQPRPEVPQRGFTYVQEESEGLLVAARGLPEVEVAPLPSGAEIRLTLLRCVGWLSRDDLATRKGPAGPMKETPEAQMPGKQIFEYALIPIIGNAIDTIRQAHAFDLPMRAVRALLHTGSLPSTMAMVEFGDDFFITCIKPAEQGEGLVVRGVLNGEKSESRLRLNLPHLGCQLVRLDEIALLPLAPNTEGFYQFTCRPWEIISLKFLAENSAVN